MHLFASFCLVVLLLLSTPTSATIEKDSGWVPEVTFKLEALTFGETMTWVSGWSYALSQVVAEQKSNPIARLLCPASGPVIGSQEILAILNEQFSGKTITAEQASSAILASLKARYPCAAAAS